MDDCLLIGHKEEVSTYKYMMPQYFECKDVGELKEYVGCKIERNKQGKVSEVFSTRDEFGIKLLYMAGKQCICTW
jgi:hypothetical protein